MSDSLKTKKIVAWRPSFNCGFKKVAVAVAVVVACAGVAGGVVWFGQKGFLVQPRAQAGDAEAQYRLGRQCFTRASTREELARGVERLQKAAQAGHAKAQTTLGLVYARGMGVEQSPELAVSWLTRAAEQGEPLAQNELATAYAKGWGVSRNLKKAVHWYSLAAASGEPTAEWNLVLAVVSQNGSLGDLTTRSGRQYPKAKLSKIERDGITIGFDAKGGIGFAKVKAGDLPQELAPLCRQNARRSYADSEFKWSKLDVASLQM